MSGQAANPVVPAPSLAGPAPHTAWPILWSYLRRRRFALALFALASGALALLVVPTLLLVRHAFDVAIPQARVGLLIALGVGIVLVRVAQSLAHIALRAWALRVADEAARSLRSDLLDRMLRWAAAEVWHADQGGRHARAVHDSERFDALCAHLLSVVMPSLPTVIMVLAALAVLNWKLTLLCIALGPVLWAGARLLSGRVRGAVRSYQAETEAFSRAISFVQLHGILIRLRGAERDQSRRHRVTIDRLGASRRAMILWGAIHTHVQRNLNGLVAVAVLVVGGAAVIHGDWTFGEMGAFYVGAGILKMQLDLLAASIPELINGFEAIGRLAPLLVGGRPEPYVGEATIDFDGRVEIRRASVRHGARVVLDAIDLQIGACEIVAVLGANGAGKSTIASLILGLVRPDTGAVFADDVPYEALDIRRLRAQIGVLPQRPEFFAGTIRENLCFGLDGCGDQDIARALALAGADSVLAGLAQGLSTMLEDGGERLSGGERQRLAIARALLGSPKLLILDEPGNHLDEQSLAALVSRLGDLPQRPALLLITHQPQIAACAHRVLRLEAGMLEVAHEYSGGGTHARSL